MQTSSEELLKTVDLSLKGADYEFFQLVLGYRPRDRIENKIAEILDLPRMKSLLPELSVNSLLLHGSLEWFVKDINKTVFFRHRPHVFLEETRKFSSEAKGLSTKARRHILRLSMFVHCHQRKLLKEHIPLGDISADNLEKMVISYLNNLEIDEESFEFVQNTATQVLQDRKGGSPLHIFAETYDILIMSALMELLDKKLL